MQIPMSIARPERALRYAAVSTIASVCGALLGYAIGALLYQTIGVPLLHFYGYEQKFVEFAADVSRNGFWFMLASPSCPSPTRSQRSRPVRSISACRSCLSPPCLVAAGVSFSSRSS